MAADRVICTASPGPLVGMLSPGSLPGRLERRLRRWRYGLGTLKLDWALSAPVPWAGERAREAGVVQVGGPLETIVASLEEAERGRFPERPALVVGQQSLHDSSRTPAGQHTLYAYARVPQRPGLADQEMAERVEAEVERYAPGFAAQIVERSVRSPADIEAENASMVGGDLASGSCQPAQQLIFRPTPRLCRGRTPIRGLYVAGGWVHPGPGVHGVSGQAAADALLGDARRRVR
jgi:phytoene dehydrogenase-like protein